MLAYGIDLRERVMRALDAGELQTEVAERFEVSERWIQKLVRRRRETGSIAAKPAAGGRQAVIRGAGEEQLKAALAERSDATLSELREACGFSGSIMCVFRALRRLGITRKKRR